MPRFYRTPDWLCWLTQKHLTWRIPAKEKKIYLTFDDGPTPGVTQNVMDILDEYKCKATFFCTGKNAEKHPEIIKELLQRGHIIGNHTFDHADGWKTPRKNYIESIEKTAKFIDTCFFRPPYGKVHPLAIQSLSKRYHIIMWSLLSYDFIPKLDTEKSVHSIIELTKKGDIVVFHDSEKAKINCLEMLPTYLEVIVNKGFKSYSLREVFTGKP
jgi:peptidoglycan/xylan/chitin deacetylase (PgdA/CDA1 family)